MVKAAGAGAVLAALFSAYAYSCTNLGTYSAVWKIKEKSAVDEIKEHISHYGWRKLLNRKVFLKAFREYENRLAVDLPTASKHMVYKVNMEYTLPFDIKDSKGNVIYPKGYTFNPLDFISIPFVYVIINGSSSKQIEWFKRSSYYAKIKSMLLICRGDVLSLEKELKIPVFYANRTIIKRFNIRAVPSVAFQKGSEFYVETIPIDDNSSAVSEH